MAKGETAKVASYLLDTSFEHTVGLKTDGTVIAVGKNYDDHRDVSDLISSVEVSST